MNAPEPVKRLSPQQARVLKRLARAFDWNPEAVLREFARIRQSIHRPTLR